MTVSHPLDSVGRMTWFWKQKDDGSEYSIYTSAYDVEVTGEALIRELSTAERKTLNEQVEAFKRTTETCRTETSLNSLATLMMYSRATRYWRNNCCFARGGPFWIFERSKGNNSLFGCTNGQRFPKQTGCEIRNFGVYYDGMERRKVSPTLDRKRTLKEARPSQ